MIEPARKHGHFDPRFPIRRRRLSLVPASAAGATSGEVGDRLDWQAFTTRFTPDRGRHDLKARLAYEAYRDGSGAWLLCSRTLSGTAGDSQVGFTAAALQAWETDGSAATLVAARG